MPLCPGERQVLRRLRQFRVERSMGDRHRRAMGPRHRDSNMTIELFGERLDYARS